MYVYTYIYIYIYTYIAALFLAIAPTLNGVDARASSLASPGPTSRF